MTTPDDKLIDAQLLDLMLRAGPRWVLWLLIGLSVLVVAVVIERVWFYARERRRPHRLADALALLGKDGPAAALAALDGMLSMDAAVARVSLERAGEGIPAVEEHVAATLERERIRFERGLAFLGTLGNNAPFVGLFGTVLGIIRAFHDLVGSSGLGSDAVMTGIAQALVATAVGLAVALPAVASYNAFARHVESAAAAAGATAHDMLAYLKAGQNAGEDAMKTGVRRGGLITEINVTPLVDIILVLLIVFMLTAHVIARQAIEVKLPKAAQGAAPAGKPLAITLTREGRFYLNGVEIGPDELREAVRAAVARDPDTQVLVAGDKDVSHGRVVWVLDLVKSLGVTTFAIQIDRMAMTPPPEAPAK